MQIDDSVRLNGGGRGIWQILSKFHRRSALEWDYDMMTEVRCQSYEAPMIHLIANLFNLIIKSFEPAFISCANLSLRALSLRITDE